METSKQNINNKAKQRKCTHKNKGKFLFCSHKSFMQAFIFSDFVLMLISLLKPRLLMEQHAFSDHSNCCISSGRVII